MKKMRNELLHLFLLVTVSLAICSCTSNQQGLNKQNDLTKQNPLNSEAQAEAQRFWDSLSVKCGDSYYAFADFGPEGQKSLRTLLEFKNFTVSVVEKPVPSPTPPKPLSEADRLNRIEEEKLPKTVNIEWDGYIKLHTGANRSFNFKSGRWEKWQDEMPSVGQAHTRIGLTKVNGQWVYTKTYESVVDYDYVKFMKGISAKIDCSQIPR